MMNPSAYVHKSAQNALARTRDRPSQAPAIQSFPPPWLRDTLDGATLVALSHISEEDQARILEDVAAKMEAGKVRNPSAYVSRNVSNFKKTSDFKMTSSVASSRGPNEDFLARFRNGNLDDKVMDALERIGVVAAVPILNEFEIKMANGEVRNPSAYVMRAIANHDKGFR
jgi:hypothetical protein